MFEDMYSGVGGSEGYRDEDLFLLRRVEITRYEQRALMERLRVGSMPGGAMSPLMALVLENAEKVADAFESEVDHMCLPFLFATDAEVPVSDFLVSPFRDGEGDEKREDADEFSESLRELVRQIEITEGLLDGLRDFNSVSLPPLPKDILDEWLVLKNNAFWKSGLLAVGTMTSVLLLTGDAQMAVSPEMPESLSEFVGRFMRLYHRLATLFIPQATIALDRLSSGDV